jgi:hypothetical protein
MTPVGGSEKIVPWDIRKVADFLGRSPGAVRNLVMRRSIPFRKVAGRLVFIEDEIVAWIKNAPGLSLEQIKNKSL